MRIVLGVGGGIAAYKAALLLRLFSEDGHEVTVVPTEAALRFVGAPTWEALSGRSVQTDVWSNITDVPHVRIGQEADLVVVAPTTADLLAKAAHGLAGDLLTNVLLTARCPVVLAPAMHTEMWEHAATRANVATLRGRGVTVIDPDSGRLTGADIGPGRLPEPEDIHAAAMAAVGGPGSGAQPQEGDLTGRAVLVSTGGTREPLDPVRYLGNRSSGKQGLAVAEAAAARGARVTLVAANLGLPVAPGIDVVPVQTALELQAEMDARAADHDVVVMVAAVADFRPADYAPAKIKKSHDPADPDAAPTIDLVRNPDILAGLVSRRGEATTPLLVGFAAETGDATGSVLAHGRDKLARKGCDLLVVNEVGEGVTFGADDTTVHVLTRGSDETVDIGPASKRIVSDGIWDVVVGSLRP
ncbi:bifunctional phosphopantothenoylcysteine decarboxylase/phosphopantothenate--cysteine ligase CoaBC [Janibacter cremeus]|uniref:bifunctional phosphopantothenoylcysteine decarboxylase/phosphopantothenate--cysteine ligase CoaBC n=1 Tax=Janibacter cremeus TaxID=1285192 RepID=UPI0023F7072C|nr:bifunctional phosphopantothenoylcysteine decarboxylase/phosphopantothenate--cysteine ligase CoaBC [Janibacter cremeus]WEV79248.1 bifunctional phosphopantothenoylcysteine decarboxylase/phosphopantothenate--cysteine ligase CoaBC [Janibacter cremeus]